MKEAYFSRVDLLLTVLPDVMKDPRLALKGGTAINLFVFDMPRLSVDIDLAYLPVEGRQASLESIDQIFTGIRDRLSARGFTVQPKFTAEGHVKQLTVEDRDGLVKIEANHVLRGSVYPPVRMGLSPKAQGAFNKFVTVQCLAEADLFAGKICATLDRQHPRDLYDIHFFLKNRVYSRPVHNAFLAYLISHNRPIPDLIAPPQQDISALYNAEFLGMADSAVSLSTLYDALGKISRVTRFSMTKEDREFLLSFKAGQPIWQLLDVNHIAALPAIKWKLHNISKMHPEKRREMLHKLDRKLLC